MHRTPLSIPELAFIAGTRGLLGAGVGLLVADRLNNDQRRAVGWTIFAIGALSTVPILLHLRRLRQEQEWEGPHRLSDLSEQEYVIP